MMGKPKIRFKGYNEDWEQRKLGEIYGSIGNAFVGTATPYYVEQGHFYLESNNVKDGQINHNSEIFINDEFYEKQKDKWLHTGDMVMVQSGHVGHAAVIPEELDNTAAHALIMFRNPKEKIEPYFLNYEYQTNKAKKKIENITTGNTIKHILASDMQEFVVDVPKYEEQKVIADYFSNLDHLITLHQHKCDEMKKLKKYMLQKMFPKNGKKVPEIRFDGFTNDWEQRKLGEVVEFFNGDRSSRYPNDSDMVPEGIPFINAGDLVSGRVKLDTANKITEEKYNELSGAKIQRGDIIYCLRGTLGKNAFVDNFDAGTVASSLVDIRPKKIVGKYLFQVLNSDIEYRQRTVNDEGAAQPNLSAKNLSLFDIPMPSEFEQEKIALYFDTLDHLITLHQHKCDELQNFKKYMLQNMFV